MPSHPIVSISHQLSTQYVPFFLTLPPHSGQTRGASDGPGRAGTEMTGAVGLGPGCWLTSTRGSAASNFCKS